MTATTTGVWWNELMTRDVERALDYYESVLGWRFEQTPFGDDFGHYHLAFRNGRPVAGCVDISSVEYLSPYKDFWLPFLTVEDCDRAIEEIEGSGGAILRKPFNMPNIGRVSIAIDSCGALHGLITPSMTN